MKKIFFAFLLLGAMFCSLGAAETQRGQWRVEAGKGTCTVILTVKANEKAMFDFTNVQFQPLLKADRLPEPDAEGYLAPGVHRWEFTERPLSFPLRVFAKDQFCLADGFSCTMPQEHYLGEFKTESDWQNGIFTVAPAEAGMEPGDGERIPVFMPEYLITGRTEGYLKPEEMVAFLKGETHRQFFDLEGKSLWLTLLLVLLGGLALNLTPCVLPLIPVNLAIIGAGMNSDKTKLDRILRGLLYGLGITVAYGLLGVIAVLTGSTFGALAGSWIFNGIAALIFLFLGLAMFGAVNFDLSRYGASIQISGAKYAGIFLLGAISATLAGACVAPVLAAVLIRAATLYAHGSNAGLLLPFLLGLGMALPWPFAAAGLSLFPKPGAWMVRVKQALGVLILILAVYYGGMTAVLIRNAMNATDPGSAPDTPAAVRIGTALEQAKREKKRVLLDFGASWCKNCTALERNTFPDPDVQEALKGFIVVRIQAEDPADPATKILLETYEVKGLPTLVILTPE